MWDAVRVVAPEKAAAGAGAGAAGTEALPLRRAAAARCLQSICVVEDKAVSLSQMLLSIPPVAELHFVSPPFLLLLECV